MLKIEQIVVQLFIFLAKIEQKFVQLFVTYKGGKKHMELILLHENKGISNKTQKPYHMLKLADPTTLENHTVSVDQSYINQPFNYPSGSMVKMEVRPSTPYDRTMFLCTKLTLLQK